MSKSAIIARRSKDVMDHRILDSNDMSLDSAKTKVPSASYSAMSWCLPLS